MHSWKDLWGKQKPISTVNVILSGNCQIIIPLQRHHCLIVPSNISCSECGCEGTATLLPSWDFLFHLLRALYSFCRTFKRKGDTRREILSHFPFVLSHNRKWLLQLAWSKCNPSYALKCRWACLGFTRSPRHPLCARSVLRSACCTLRSGTESDAFKSADNLKWSANKYVIMRLSEWQMGINSVFG